MPVPSVPEAASRRTATANHRQVNLPSLRSSTLTIVSPTQIRTIIRSRLVTAQFCDGARRGLDLVRPQVVTLAIDHGTELSFCALGVT